MWRASEPIRQHVVRRGDRMGLAAHVWSDVADLDGRLSRLAAGTVRETDLDIRPLARELLPDWYDDWVLAEREVLVLRRVAGLEQVADQQLVRGRYAEAVEAAMAAIAAEPLRESARLRLLHIQLAEGNAAEALRHYDQFAALRQRQLGVAPSEHLQHI